MISINNKQNLFIQPNFKGNSKNNSYVSERYEIENSALGKKSSYAVSSYGQAMVKANKTNPKDDEYARLLTLIPHTSDYATMSLDDAVEEMKNVNTTNKRKTDLILASTFETDKSDVLVSKKALYILKKALIANSFVPKLEDAVRTCLDAEFQEFDSRKFDSLFNAKGQIRISARLKSRPTNYDNTMKNAKRVRREQIQSAVNKACPIEDAFNSDFKVSDLFVPLTEERNSLLADIDNIQDMPQKLKENMADSINKNQFNLRQVHNDYYSLLNECETLSDVKALYPELECKEKPVKSKGDSPRSLKYRLANENYDEVMIDTLKKAYLELQPANDMYVELKNSPITTYQAMKNAGYAPSVPSKEMLSLMKKSEKLENKYANMPKLKERDIKQIANKHAIRTSKVWTDYKEMTSHAWLPVRLIKHKRNNPTTSAYKTSNMVNSYLYNLYKRDKNADYPMNPLEKFDDKNYLNRQMQGVVNATYMTRYKRADENIKDDGFIEFQNKFDKKAIGKSFEHLEDNYTKSFFSKYWTPDRVGNLKKNMQNAYDMIYEKVILNEQITNKEDTHKQVTDKDVDELLEEDLSMDTDSLGSIDEDKYSKMKYRVSLIKNKELKERCLSCVDDTNQVDSEYFDSMYNILDKSTDEYGLDEDKALAHVYIHDKYLNQLLNTMSSETEDDFAKKELASYENNLGDYDYERYLRDTKSEAKYFQSAAKLLADGESEFNDLIENKFIFENNADYNDANTVIGYYESIPDVFKPSFIKQLGDSIDKPASDVVDDLSQAHEKISSWNYENDEVLVMDKDKIPQKVVITHNAKENLLDMVGGNLNTFDAYLKKFYSAAQIRTGNRAGQGVKTVQGSGYDAEIKIMGAGGNLRMYSRPVTDEDKQKYETNDGINLKYVFDTCGDHL